MAAESATRRHDIEPGVEALIRLEEHDKTCAERMQRIDQALSTMSNRLWLILGAAVLGACAFAFEYLRKAG